MVLGRSRTLAPRYYAAVYEAAPPVSRPADALQIVASILAGFSFLAFLALFLVLWLPVWLTGSGASLLLWPLVFLLAVLPWSAAIAALILIVKSLNKRDSRASVVVCVTAVISVLSPVALWFGVP